MWIEKLELNTIRPFPRFKHLLLGSVFDRTVVLSWQIWLLVKPPYKLIKLESIHISITSSKIWFGTQFKAHIVANRAVRHLRLNTFTAGACKRDGATLFLGCFRVEYAQLGKFYAFPVCPRLLVSSIPRYEYEANDGLHGGRWRGGETITAGL